MGKLVLALNIFPLIAFILQFFIIIKGLALTFIGVCIS